MGRRKIISLFVVLLSVSSIESAWGTDVQAVIRGTASYRERIALPPEAVFEAVIVDVSRADAPEGDNAALESAYSEARHEPGEPLLVTLQGRIVSRPRRDGAGMQMTLVPERFMNV